MNLQGLTDLPGRAEGYARCRCGSLARVASGLCVSCLLRTGLDANGETADDFDTLLAAIDVPDRDWQLGNYRILEEVGRGGMGVIYRARHAPSRRIVALKRVLTYHSDSQETLTRFQREATAAASLDHPNILPIYDVGVTEDGLPFFTMKFAVGGSLLTAKGNYRDAPRRAAVLMAAVARAVDYAHGQGILHRDLKPGNILLDARGTPLVSDFGLAKWLDKTSDLTRTLTVFGTPGYIAPEQSAHPAAEITPVTDVYSLGAILFELLSGRPPFLGEHAVAVMRQAAETDAPKLRGVVPKASRDLETICARCLERDPALRYQSALALAEDLERWLQNRPIIARRISPAARLYRWSRRNPVLAGTLAMCILFGGFLISRQVQNWKLEKEIRQAQLMRNSVAVLPLLDLDRATEDSNWSASFTQSLQAALSKFGNARVIRSESADAKSAVHSTRTRTALFATRRQTGNGMRLALQLLDGDGNSLWEQIFDFKGESADLSESASRLAPRLYAILAANDWSTLIASKRDPGLQNEQARELITAGRELHSRYSVLDWDRAISCFERALALEPNSALAHAYLAMTAANRMHLVGDTRFLDRAEREAREALRLDPTVADCHLALAGALYQRGDLRQALEEQIRALELNGPEEKVIGFIGMTLETLGQPDRALPWYEMARRLAGHPGTWDPLLGDCWSKLDDDEAAETAYRRATVLESELPRGWVGISRLRLLEGKIEEAREICRAHRQQDVSLTYTDQMLGMIEFFSRNFGDAERIYTSLEPKDPEGGTGFYGGLSYKSALGRLAIDRNRGRGRQLLQECLANERKSLANQPDNPEFFYRLAAVESSLGQAESAIEHLQAAVQAGWTDYRSLSRDPRFDAISDDISFQTILGKLKLKVENLRSETRKIFAPQKNPKQNQRDPHEKVEQPGR